MLKLKKFSSSNNPGRPCYYCDLFELCYKNINDDGSIKHEFLNHMNHPSIRSYYKEQIIDALSYAIKCKKRYPNYIVKNEHVTQHVLVGKGGNEIFRANSFWGLIGGIFCTAILSVLAILIIGLVFSGIGSLFK